MVAGLLARLALSANRVVTVDALLSDLWPIDSPEASVATLRVHVSRLRSALRADRDLLQTLSPGYTLQLPEEQIDLFRCEQLVSDSDLALRRGDHEEAERGFGDAVALFTGPPLHGLEQPFAVAGRSRLEALRATALEGRLFAGLNCGRHRELLPELEALTAEFPLRERLWEARILALVRNGWVSEALDAYRTLKETLADELGIDPSPELQEMESTLLRDPARLAWVSPKVSDLPAARPPHRDTFVVLLTDVANSTSLWEMVPAAMAVASQRYDELVTRAVEGAGGRVVRHRGENDSTFSELPDVVAAARAAATIQAAVSEDLWPEQCPLQVRIAVHAGAAVRRDGDVLGAEIARAAQVRALGHGGQTLLSEAATGGLQGQVPSGLLLVDHGLHRLRGSRRPERIHELVTAGRSQPPVPLTSTTAPTLPEQTTSFVGREHELGLVQSLLVSHRLVTLVGPGGAGKTRLAVRVADMIEAGYEDGAWLADLSPITRDEQVLPAIATGLQMPPDAGSPTTDAVAAFVGTRQLLLLVDNCEQVVHAASAVLEDLIHRCPGLRVLATSRERLRVDDEGVLDVRPLPTPPPESLTADEVLAAPAAWLFRDRARAADPSFSVDDGLAPVVGEICRELDGLPLAIELAAADIRVLSPVDLLERLRGRLTTSGARRHSPHRQQTLHALVDWSYGLLDDHQATVFRCISVFQGSFSVAEAERVAGPAVPAPAVFPSLTALVDKSLVVVDPDKRLRLLVTLRGFASDRLDEEPDEAMQSRRHHAAVLLDVAEGTGAVGDTERGAAVRTVDLRRADIVQALGFLTAHGPGEDLARMVVALVPYWIERGRSRAAVEALDHALALPGLGQEIRGRLLLGGAEFHQDFDYDRCVELFQEALQLFRTSGDVVGQARAERGVAAVEVFRGNLTLAREHFQRSLELSREDGDLSGQAEALLGLGQSGLALDYDEARASLEAAAAIFRKLGRDSQLAWTLNGLAQLLAFMDDLDGAKECVTEARAFFDQVGSSYGVAWSDCQLGAIAHMAGDFPTSLAHFQAACRARYSSGHNGTMLWAVSGLGQAYMECGHLVEARQWMVRALELTRGLSADSKFSWQWMCHHFARLLVRENRARAAALLIGARQRLQEEDPVVIGRSSEREFQTALDAVTTALGPAAHDVLSRGRELTNAEIAEIAEFGVVLRELSA